VDERNLVSLLHLIEHGFNGDRLDLLDEVLAPDLVVHGPVPIAPGREGLKAALGAIRGAFPDSHVAIDDLAFGGATIYRRWTIRGTHTGDFFGVAPTGRPIHLSGVDVDRFEGGMVVEHWSFWDRAELLSQIGVGP
jgi:predicted ester cyclase